MTSVRLSTLLVVDHKLTLNVLKNIVSRPKKVFVWLLSTTSVLAEWLEIKVGFHAGSKCVVEVLLSCKTRCTILSFQCRQPRNLEFHWLVEVANRLLSTCTHVAYTCVHMYTCVAHTCSRHDSVCDQHLRWPVVQLQSLHIREVRNHPWHHACDIELYSGRPLSTCKLHCCVLCLLRNIHWTQHQESMARSVKGINTGIIECTFVYRRIFIL